MIQQPALSESPYVVSPTPVFRLEPEHPEEEAIIELDQQIADRKRRQESADDLIKQRDELLDAWKKRLEEEKMETPERISYLEDTLDRIRRDYEYAKDEPVAG